MDAGQIMMQMSTGIAPTVSAPASAETATVPAGEPSDSSFAGMLRGMSSLVSAPAAVATEATPMRMTAAADSGREPAGPKPAEVNADIMAALLAVVGTPGQMPAAVAAEDKPEIPVISAQPDALMPQNVELLASGTKVVPSAGGNGSMPESGQKVEHQDKPADPAQPVALMPQDVALLEVGAQIILPAGDNGRMPESGQKIEHQDKPEKPADPVALMPQDMALLEAGAQIILPAGINGRMPESGQKAEPQADDRSLPLSSVGLVMPAPATKVLSQTAMAAQLEQPEELSQNAQTMPKADSMLKSETTTGKIAATDIPKVVTKEGGRDMLEKSVQVASNSVGAKMETAALSVEEAPVVQGPIETKSTQLTAATAVNGMAANEIPAVQAGRTQVVHPAQVDANIRPSAEKTPEQMDIPSDVQMVKASAMVQHPNPATVVMEAAGRKSENQEDGTPVHLDTTTIKKNIESVSADSTKVSSSSAPENELLNDGGKDPSDHGMNNQFHQTAAHQQVKADMGTSLGSISGPGQKDALHSDLSENVFRQVKEVLANREVKAGNEQITVRLTPEHLGELTLNLKMENQQLKVEIVAANRGVRDALMQHAENLKESLSRQNITMESFDVVTSGGQRGFEQNDRGWKQLAQQQFMAGTSSGGYRYRAPEVEEAVVPRYGMQKQYAMVDVHY